VSTNDNDAILHKPLPPNLKMKALVVLIVGICVVAWGISSRSKEQAGLAQSAQDQANPIVKVIQPSQSKAAPELVLPGTLQAYYSATVYARVNGYLKSWSADIGAPVKAGQVLAVIETPELDQQLKQSEANLESALANQRLTEITSNRWKNLLASDSVSKQEADEKNGDNEAKKALVVAAQADVNRLRALASFKQITAPFDGIITSRKTDIGALINAGHDAGHELFTVADNRKLRLYVNVPQSYAHKLNVGMKADLDVPSFPGKTFEATLRANSGAVNESSGSVLVELEVDNKLGQLMPGGYGNVKFKLSADASLIQIPASALVFRKEGLSIATLTTDNHVAFRPIQISHDQGSVVEIANGISPTDRIIDNPPDSIENGDLVQVSGSTGGKR